MVWGCLFAVVAHYYLLLLSSLIPGTSLLCIGIKLASDQAFSLSLCDV